MAVPRLVPFDAYDLDTLLALAERKAAEEADGHLTLMRFTTGWKCMVGTPNLDIGEGREEIRRLTMHSSLKEALVDLLVARSV
jgi:hypothetical protein